MHPELRARFNADFTPARYAEMLRVANETERWPVDFRISETPIFLTDEFATEVAHAAEALVAQTRLGMQTVVLTEFSRHASELFYMRDGREVKIERIYNRVIFDELLRRPDLSFGFSFQDEVDAQSIGHPNWYFRISKHSLPFLK